MKKIFAGVVLPTLAAVAVIGSGFSVWFFGENQDSVSTNANVAVENLIRIGNLKMDVTNMKLNLDQTKAVREFILDSDKYVSGNTNGNADKVSNYDATAFGGGTVTKGVYLTADEGFDGKISYDHCGYDLIPGVDKFEIVTTFEFIGAVKNYVGVTTTNADLGTWTKRDETAGVFEFKWKTPDPTLGGGITEMMLPMDNNDAAGNSGFKFEYLKYDSSKHYLKGEGVNIDGIDVNRSTYTDATSVMATVEPHNDAEYKKMNGDVSMPADSSKLKITTVATLVDASK